MRKAITTLQSCARLKEGAEEAEVTGRDVREMSGLVPDKWVGGMVDVCKKNSFEKMQVGVCWISCKASWILRVSVVVSFLTFCYVYFLNFACLIG